MKCPTCKRETAYEDNPYRPFCSDRCKLIDLGKWAGEQFRVPTSERPPEEIHRSNGNPQDED
ncbi:MAG: DNA gyrase inhibitor YacG [Acidobacteria bacterium]|nr:DNA gyrase inhibitor YacG [Acidobacteriota bacterium]